MRVTAASECRRRRRRVMDVDGRPSGAAVHGDKTSLPQQQHSVGDVGRRVTGRQRVERHARDDAARNVEMHRHLDPGARHVPRQALQTASGQNARLPRHSNHTNK